ncbi:hypothetical protein As57867_020785, partial [Aphanomyces stellatus]
MEDYVFPLLLVCAILLSVPYCFYKSICAHRNELETPLVENNFVGVLYGLNRNDVEDLLADTKRWTCDVCRFSNPPSVPVCALCSTSQGVMISDSQVGGGGIHPTHLSPAQWSARMRKEWVRTIDQVSGKVVWKQTALGTTSVAAFIVTSMLPTMTEDTVYGEVAVNEIAFVPGVRNEINATIRGQDTTDLAGNVANERNSDDTLDIEAISINDMKPKVHVQLACVPLTMRSAGRTLMATTLSPWLVHQIQQLTEQPFSVKYAALLKCIRATIDVAGHMKLKVYRAKLFQESLQVLSLLEPQHFCSRTRIELLGELGVDAGGLQREWYTLLTQAIFDPAAGLFVATDSYGYTFNPAVATSTEHLKMYRAVGRLLARSILDEQVLPFHFCVPVFKMILGTPLSATDMLFMDHQIHASLSFVSTTKDIESLCLDFSVALPSGDVAELIPNGQATMVTAANQ